MSLVNLSYWFICTLSLILLASNGRIVDISTDQYLILYIAGLFFFWVYIVLFRHQNIKPKNNLNKIYGPNKKLSLFKRAPFYLALFSIFKFYSYGQVYFFMGFILCLLCFLPIRVLTWVVLVFYFLLIYIFPKPSIDVFLSNSLAAEFMLKGLNPYTQNYPDIYNGFYDYKPGFLYWPGTLYLETISQFLFHDIRFILAIAWWGTPFLFPITKYTEDLKRLWWLLPTLPFSFIFAWVDPLISFFAGLALWAEKNKAKILLAAAIAFAASLKQHGFLIGFYILLPLLTTGRWREFFTLSFYSIIIFSLLLAPFLFWDFEAFSEMTIGNLLNAKSRVDSFNLIGLILHFHKTYNVAILELLAGLLGFVIALYHVKKNATANKSKVIAESWVIMFGMLTIFGKFAFYNYYALLVSFIILSLSFASKID